tara:strand:+ start:1049 stop:1402 length:354 start_codon:yes stop_codon:yes gene_type:complete
MSKFKYFNKDEFKCQHTGKNKIQDKLIYQLDKLRENCGFPFVITSGYRDSTHPIEAKKTKAGTHALGLAADIKVNNGVERYTIVREAIKLGFRGIGIANTFVHVDVRDSKPSVMWTY